MKEIVEKIVEEEKKARKQVEEVKEEAKKLRIKAEQEAESIIKEIRENCKQETKDMLNRAEEEALAQKKVELDKSVTSVEKLWEERSKEVKNIIEELFTLIIEKDHRE